MMTTQINSKWSCDVCTYDNYHSSLKCVMCRRPKLQLSQAQDIYSLRDELPVEPQPQLIEASGEIDNCDKIIDSNQVDALNEQFNTDLKISDRANSPDNEEASSSLDTLALSKWSCSACTYQNWPKSFKCIMCGTRGPRKTSPSPDNSLCEPPTIITKRVKSPEKDLAATINTDSNICTLKRSSSRRRLDDINSNYDRAWLAACVGVVQGDWSPIAAYLHAGGDPTRSLTSTEVTLLNRPSAFDTGHTLVHLAVRFHREEILSNLLNGINATSSSTTVKRVPSHVAHQLADEIGKHFLSTIRVRKSLMPCPFVTEFATFSLPFEIEELPRPVQRQLLDELLDRNVQQELEIEEVPPVINWSSEVCDGLCSRLYALWNRSAGDCLLDSLMQSTWGIFDKDNILRKALADCLHESNMMFYPRWKEYEAWQAKQLEFCLDEYQWAEDWAALVSQAERPGSSLAQLHVFALAHVLRRPIIVYAVKYVKNYRGDRLGYTNFEGVYLPLLWESSFCIKSPITLAYTRGHFSSLVPVEPLPRGKSTTYLPLVDHDHKLLPIHFVTKSEMGHEENILKQWLDVCLTENGLLLARQRLHKRPLLVAQMLEEWLNYYRKQAQMTITPFSRPISIQDYSSEGESEQE
ncbi:hypothetical protein ACI65C_001921 [Semiaphis heraclei]